MFVAKVVEKVSASEFPDSVKQTAKQIADQLGTSPEIFISGELNEDDQPKTGQSKVGGKPDVPASFKWPNEEEDEDAPLQFIAQLNLAEVHPHDLEGRLPAKGMVWLFSIADGDRAYGYEIDSSTTKVVFMANPGPLKPRAIPEVHADDEDATIEERKIDFGPIIGLDAFRDSGVKDVILEAMRELGGRSGPVFMLNQREAGSDDEAEDSGGTHGGFMLADLDMHAIASNAFGEGILGFVLTAKDLAAGELSNADTVFETGS